MKRLWRGLRALLYLGVLALVTGCAGVGASPPAPVLSGDAVYIEQAWIRPSPTVGGNGALYLTIVNPTDAADRLLTVETPAAEMAELHETIQDNNVMRMRPLANGLDVPARQVVELKPGGRHVMLMKVREELKAGQQVEVVLVFEQAGRMTLIVPVAENAP